MSVRGEESGTFSRVDVHRRTATPSGVESRSKTLLGRAHALVRFVEPALGEEDRAFVVLDAREITQRVCDRVRIHAEAKGVEVLMDCECSLVVVQPRAFAKALYALLDNAVQAANAGSAVRIEMREADEGDVLWQIQDAGAGMGQRGLAQLGRPPDAAGPESWGLGVAIAWVIVERHGGMLRFESAPGIGTTASVWIPGVRERLEDATAGDA
jgi:signal transduction histidine kinase